MNVSPERREQRLGRRPPLVTAVRSGSADDDLGSERIVRHTNQKNDQDLGNRLSGIAHEFNNLLTTIMGNVEIAMQDLPADSPVLSLLSDIGTAARSGMAITKQLSEVAGTEAPLCPSNPCPPNPRPSNSDHCRSGRQSTSAPQVDAEPRSAACNVDLPASSRGNETVLVVEDSSNVRKLSAAYLERLGYHVLCAATAAEACEIAARHAAAIDLLLTDVVLPGMNGRDLAKRIGESHPEAKVIFSSGYPEDLLSQHGVSREGASFLAKPYRLDALAKKIRELLG